MGYCLCTCKNSDFHTIEKRRLISVYQNKQTTLNFE